MYIKRELRNATLGTDKIGAIGPDAVRFKYINDFSERPQNIFLEGTIYNVGLDFVDLLDDNHCLVTTILTEKITNVKWLDQKCRESAGKCDDHYTCNCMEFRRCMDCRDKLDRKRYTAVKAKNKYCTKCNTSCICKDITKRRIDRLKYKNNKFKQRENHYQEHFQDERLLREEHYSFERHHNDRCGHRFTCFRDHVIPFCDDRIELRLAGLTDDLNFQLLKHKGCKVRLDIS